MALQECGTLRILFAAFCSVIGKLFRQRGWFYIVAGPKARGIDGPTEGTIPPYDHYVVLTPDDPNGTARKLAAALGHPVAIVDINDLGANILGFSQKEPSMDQLARILGDNPWVSPANPHLWVSSVKSEPTQTKVSNLLR